MNKTLLLAVGDSWTFGLGAQEPEIFKYYPGEINTHLIDNVKTIELAKPRSWPAVLSKRKDWDVVNLGICAGGANAIHQRFLKYLSDNEDFIKQYDTVKVVYLLTQNRRFSFVKNSGDDHIVTAIFDSKEHSKRIFPEDYREVNDFIDTFDRHHDMVKFLLMYLLSIQTLCKNRGFEFYWGSSFTFDTFEFAEYLQLLDYTRRLNEPDEINFLHMFDVETMATCGHPNEAGYKLIADYIEEKMKKVDDAEDDLVKVEKKLDKISDSFCLAKWHQVTLHLQNGFNHSCHHPRIHKTPLEELENNPSALHNTEFKKQARKQMLEGDRPSECSYCWDVEDNMIGKYSDRVYKSRMLSDHGKDFTSMDIIATDADHTKNVNPKYVEISFSNTCNLKCSYCSPIHSSRWYEELKNKGEYPLEGAGYSIEKLERQGQLPLYESDENPYVDAFWEWWPELSEDLEDFRITGGEPLLDENTFKVLEMMESGKYQNLRLSINTNACVPDKIFDRFVDALKRVEGKVKDITIFTSVDGHGKQAEYGRFGLDYDKWKSNVERLLSSFSDLKISIMCTSNIFSVTTMRKLIEEVHEWKKTYNVGEHRQYRVVIDFSMLKAPSYQRLDIMTDNYKSILDETAEFIKFKSVNYVSEGGFFPTEVESFLRMVDFFKGCGIKSQKDLSFWRRNFYSFVTEHDNRRGTNFVKTFPELFPFYLDCKLEYDKRPR